MAEEYAKPESYEYRFHYVQQRRKKRKDESMIPRRYFTSMNSEDSHYFLMDSAVTLSGNHKITTYSFFDNKLLVLFGSTSNFNRRGRILSDGTVQWRPADNSSTVSTPAGAALSGFINKIEFERVGATATITVNGVVSATGGTSTLDVDINAVGNTGGSTGSGVVFNTSVEISSVETNFWEIGSDGNSVIETDGISGNNLTRVNLNAIDTEYYQFNEDANPVEWVSKDSTKILPVAQGAE